MPKQDTISRPRAQTAASLYRKALLRHWPSYVAGVFALLMTSLTEVLTPKFVQWGLDLMARAVAGRDFTPVLPGFAQMATPLASLARLMHGFLTCIALGLVGRWAWRQLLARRSHGAGYTLKLRLWDVLRHQSLATFQRYTLGDLMNRATGDVNASRFIHGFTLAVTYDHVFFTVLAVTAMALIDPWLMVGCLAVLPFLPRPIARLARREHDQHASAQEALSRLSDTISQAVSTVRLQRATATHALWTRRLEEQAQAYAARRYEVLKTGWRIFPLGALPTLFAYMVLLTFGTARIRSGHLTVGEFVALQSYVVLLQAPLFELGTVISEWQKGFASLKRLVEIFNLGGPRRARGRGEDQRILRPEFAVLSEGKEEPAVAVHNLAFRYGAQAATSEPGVVAELHEAPSRLILRDVSLEVARGEWIGVLGPVGAGKSTLLNVLSGVLSVSAGTVRVFGHEVTPRQEEVNPNVLLVGQRAFLFAGTIRRNLVLGDRVEDDDLWRLLEIVQLANEVRSLPGQLDAWIGEWGINLSGGQKQRLALARALLRPRPLMLLDDCLSAVDAATEEAIVGNLAAELEGVTVIWVAHRASTLRHCKRIYELQDGVLRETSP